MGDGRTATETLFQTTSDDTSKIQNNTPTTQIVTGSNVQEPTDTDERIAMVPNPEYFTARPVDATRKVVLL